MNQCLGRNEPLPSYVLTPAAQERKAERALAMQRREMQLNKKNVPIVPVREAVPLAANSVAARRLAAKRSGAVGTIDAAQSLGTVMHPGSNVPKQAQSSDFLFDQHVSDAPIQQSKSYPAAPVNAFDLFSTDHTSQFINTAPAPVANSAPAQSSTFDLFDASPIQAAPSSAATASFDMFSFQSTPQPPPASAHNFDVFASNVVVPAKASSQSTASTFDAFSGYSGTSNTYVNANANLLDSFPTAPQVNKAQQQQSVLSLFDQQSSTTQPGRPGNNSDPFAVMGNAYVPPGPGAYGAPRPPPSSGLGGGAYNPYNAGMTGAPQMVRSIQPQSRAAADPFGSLDVLGKK